MRFIILPIALALAIAPASAQTGERLAALAAARDLLVSTGFERQMELSGMAMANTAFEHNVAQQEQKLGTSMPDSLKQKIHGIMNEQLAAMLADMKHSALDDAAQVYAEYFTAEELHRLAVLNSDPVMRKAQSLLPRMMPQLAQIGLKAASKHEPALQAKIKEAVDEWAATQKIKGSSS